MPSQKLPLFGGIIAPVHNGVYDVVPASPVIAAIPTIVASPLDKALQPRGTQAYYELHLWLIPGFPKVDNVPSLINNEIYNLYAYPDDNPAAARPIWSGNLFQTFGGNSWAAPIKILDGYPIRGNVTLAFTVNRNKADEIDQYPEGVQLFGYYYRVGEGTEIHPERRYIGEPSPDADEVTKGIPLLLPAGEKKIIHQFESNRIDEMSLAWTLPGDVFDPSSIMYVELTFEDENGNPLIPGHKVSIIQFYSGAFAGPVRNAIRDPQSVYPIKDAVFGSGFQAALGLPSLHHLSIENKSAKGDMYAHGYFTRR
jgi:hypothetical protein